MVVIVRKISMLSRKHENVYVSLGDLEIGFRWGLKKKWTIEEEEAMKTNRLFTGIILVCLVAILSFIGCGKEAPTQADNKLQEDASIAKNSTALAKPGGCVAAPPGLVSWWPGDGNAFDIVGGNNGTMQNGATFASGKVGQAFSFDGVDDYVRISNDLSLSPTNAVSIGAWIKFASIPGKFELVRKQLHLGAGYDVRWQDGTLYFWININGSWVNVTYSTSWSVGSWLHIFNIFDGDSLRIYANGVLVASTAHTGTIFYDASNVSIGSGIPHDPSYNFHGLIDELEFYHRALTTEEVAAIYGAGRAGKCKKVTICHKPGAPDQRTLVIPIQALPAHLRHGDTVGPC